MSASQDGSSASQNGSIQSNPSAPAGQHTGRNAKRKNRQAAQNANSQSGADSGPSTPITPTIMQSSTPLSNLPGPSTAKPKPISQTSHARKACHTCNLTTHAVANCPVTIKNKVFIPRVKKRNQVFKRLDWECGSCGAKQFAENTACRCGGLRADASYIVETSGGQAGGDFIRPGDWRCRCGLFHVAVRETCSGEKGCGADKRVDSRSMVFAGPEYANKECFAFPGPTPQRMLDELAGKNMDGATTDPQMHEQLEGQICADTFPTMHATKIDSRDSNGQLILLKSMHVVIGRGRPHGWTYAEWEKHKKHFKRQQSLMAGETVEQEDDDEMEEQEERQAQVVDKGKGPERGTWERKVAAMQQEIDDLRSDQLEIRTARDLAIADHTAAQSQLADSRNAEQACNDKMASLKSRLTTAGTSLEKERGNHAAAREEIRQLEAAAADNDKNTEAARALRVEVSQLKREKAALEERVDRLTADNNKLSAAAIDNKTTERHINQLSEQIGELRAVNEKATSARETANAELRSLGTSLNELVAGVREAGDPVQAGASMVVKINFLADKIGAFKSKVEDVKAASQKVASKERTRANDLARQLAQAEKTIDDDQKEVTRRAARASELSSELSKKVQEQQLALNESERELGIARESAAAAKELIAALADTMRNDDEDKVDKTKSLESLCAVLADLAERKVKLLATAESEIDNLTDKNIELQDELESARPSPDTPTLFMELPGFGSGSGSESGDDVAEMVSSGTQTDEVEVAAPTSADHATQTTSLPTATATQVDESALDPVPGTTNSDGTPTIVEPAAPIVINTMAQPGWSLLRIVLWILVPVLVLAIGFCLFEGSRNSAEREIWQLANKETIAMLWRKQGGQDDSMESAIARLMNWLMDLIGWID